jgi:hypothetical protein
VAGGCHGNPTGMNGGFFSSWQALANGVWEGGGGAGGYLRGGNGRKGAG